MLPAKIAEHITAEIPKVDSEIFEDQPDSCYWIGKVAVNNVINNPDFYLGAAKLRANVYVDEKHLLPIGCKDGNGCEKDEDDDRSLQFACVEKINDEETRVIGTSRLVVKRDQEDLLPVEKLFPDIFEAKPAKVGAVEVSRFISRHEKRGKQHLIALALIRTMTQNAVNNQNKEAYFIIEEPLWRLLHRMGLPMERLAEPREVKEYGNTLNMPVKIIPEEIVKTVDEDIEEKLPLTKFFKNENGNLGLGFYPDSLVRG